MTWVGTWTLRFLVIIIGAFVVMLALNLLGLNKTSNPFTTWSGFIQCLALSVGIAALLVIEMVIEHYRWIVGPPFHVSGPRDKPSPPDPPLN